MSYLYLILTLLTTQEFENTLLSFGPCSHEILANVQVYWSISKLIFFFFTLRISDTNNWPIDNGFHHFRQADKKLHLDFYDA